MSNIKELYDSYLSGEIDFTRFSEEIAGNLPIRLFLESMQRARTRQDAALLSKILWSNYQYLEKEFRLTILVMILFDDWHREHEEIISALQDDYSGSQVAVQALKYFVYNLPEKIRHEDLKESILFKCFYAIQNNVFGRGEIGKIAADSSGFLLNTITNFMNYENEV